MTSERTNKSSSSRTKKLKGPMIRGDKGKRSSNANDNAGASTNSRPSEGFRNPDAADVLCGRGGGINNHIGNVNFRKMINDRKQEYSVARNKAEKSAIAQEVIDAVWAAGGRFLQRAEKAELGTVGTEGIWVEVELEKAIAKTGQALREGAPITRAKVVNKKETTRLTKRRRLRKPSRKRYHDESDEEYFPSYTVKKEAEEEKKVVYPIIRGYADGHRGKQLIIPPPDVDADVDTTPSVEKKLKLSLPENPLSQSECPTPPPHENLTPTLLSMPPLDEPGKFSLSQEEDPSSVTKHSEPLDMTDSLKLTPSFSRGTASRQQSNEQILSVLEPIDLSDVVKPEQKCVRVPSLTPSEWGFHSNGDFRPDTPFQGDEPFQDPFGNEENNHHSEGNAGLSDIDFINDINEVLRSKSSRSTSTLESDSHKEQIPANNSKHESDKKNTSEYRQTLRSFMSSLSDIQDQNNGSRQDEGFNEGLKTVYGAVNPGLTSKKGEPIFTHLIPYNSRMGRTPLKRGASTRTSSNSQ